MVALLFLCPFICVANELESDTIIVGNTTLLIERVVEVDSLAHDQVKEPLKKSDESLSIGAFFNSGVCSSSLTSSEYSSLNEFTGKPSRGSFTYGGGLRAEYRIYDAISIYSEIGLDQITWQNKTTDLSLVDDSLYFFESLSENELSQIIRNRYEVGGSLETETDTIGMNVSDDALKRLNLSIPLGVRYEQPFANRKSTWTWDVSLAMVYHRTLKISKPNLLFIQTDPANDALELTDYELRDKYFTARLEFGVVKKVGEENFISLRYQAETPSQLMKDSQIQEINWVGWNNRLKIGFNIFL